MNKLISAALSCVALVVATTAYGQGTVNFANRVGSSPNYTVNAIVTDAITGLGVQGSGFSAQLYYLDPVSSSFQPVAGVAPFFSSAANRGVFNAGASATKTLANIAPGANVTLQVRAWENLGGTYTSYEAAVGHSAVGISQSITIATGGVPDPVTGIASFPANMVGLASFSISAVPEPSTYALIGMAASSVWFIRRRRS